MPSASGEVGVTETVRPFASAVAAMGPDGPINWTDVLLIDPALTIALNVIATLLSVAAATVEECDGTVDSMLRD